MIKSSSKNGITVDKDIELVMKNTGFTPWYYYLLQFVLLGAVSLSVCGCFASGLGISINYGTATFFILVFVALFMTMYSFRSLFRYVGLITMFLYVMFGYINLERLQEGFARLYNIFIRLYNEYFNDSQQTVAIVKSEYENAELFFVLFIMFLVTAVICYSAMFGRTMFFYVLITVPIVFLSFIVGVTPSMLPYIIYVSGTMALFAGVISERYGLFSKVNRLKKENQVFLLLEKTRVRVQTYCAVLMLLLFSIVYIWYSPERYEQEFDAKEVKNQIQTKIKEVTSSDLLKDTIFNRFTGENQARGNSGLSNGKLGRIGKITYANKTALKVNAYYTGSNDTIYLKGYVGEQYEGNRWTTLSKKDKQEIEDVDMSLLTSNNVEMLSSSLFNQLNSSMYGYLPFTQLKLEVDNVSADETSEYIPYNCIENYSLDDGKVKANKDAYSYYQFHIPDSKDGLTYQEMLYKYGKVSSILQLNTMNKGILDKYYDTDIDMFESVGVPDNNYEINVKDIGPYDLSLFDKSITSDKKVSVYSNVTESADEAINTVSQINQYARDENIYFNKVLDIYTKLPDSGLERVKDLVKDHHVDIFSKDMGGQDYTSMDEIDTTAYARAIYNKYKDADFLEDTEELYSSDFTYDQLTNQDKIFDALMYVKDYLATNTSYTLAPGVTPSNEDYVEYFLFENKKGYCMHYASAATVMLRAMGVPARYAEGYIVTSSDLANGEVIEEGPIDGANGTVKYVRADIKDTNAHAWVEVYLPGYGWTPIEMTAPYSTDGEVEVPPVNSNPNATLKPTKQPTPTPQATSTPQTTTTPSNTPKVTGTPSNPTKTATPAPSFTDKMGKWYNGLSNSVKRTIKVATWTIIVIVLAIIILIIRFKIIWMLHTGKWQRYETGEKILYEYELLQKMTGQQLRPYATNESYEQYAVAFVQKYPFINEEDAKEFFAITLKAKFGMSAMSEEELQKVIAFYQLFTGTMFNNASKLKKWYYKFILVLR